MVVKTTTSGWLKQQATHHPVLLLSILPQGEHQMQTTHPTLSGPPPVGGYMHVDS